MSESAVADSYRIEMAARDVTGQLRLMGDIRGSEYDSKLSQKIMAMYEKQDQSGYTLDVRQTAPPVAASSEPAINVTVQTSNTFAPKFDSFDPAGAKKAWEDHLEPELMQRLDDNTSQTAAKIGKYVGRYQKRM